MKTKLFAMLLTLTACIEMAIANGTLIDGIYYRLNGQMHTATVSYYGAYSYYSKDYYKGNMVIPSSVTYNGTTYNVTSIGENAFVNCTNLTDITIPNCVTSIGRCAFYRCTKLTSLTLPDSLTTIGDSAFAYNKITSIVIPDSVKTLSSKVFYQCTNLTTVSLPANLQRINGSAFSQCNSLNNVVVPEHVTAIGDYAFSNCTSLVTISLPDSSNIAWGSGMFSGCTSLPVYDNIRYADKYLIKVVGSNIETSYEIREETRWIDPYAFSNCTKLTSISIPKNVTNLEETTFGTRNHITWDTVTINSNAIVSKTYSASHSLTSIFTGVHLFKIGDDVRKIGDYAFCRVNYSFWNISMSDSITYIGAYAFKDASSMKSVTIPANVTCLYPTAFQGCTSLTSITWNAINYPQGTGAQNFSNGPFYPIREQITSFTIGENVVRLPSQLCAGMKNLPYVIIPNSVIVIDGSVFNGCSKFTSITIPSSLHAVGSGAFGGCTNLQEVHIMDSTWCSVEFGSPTANPLYYAQKLYLNNELFTDLVVPDNITNIGSYAFYNYPYLNSAIIGNDVTRIGRSAFENCSSLSKISIGTNVEDLHFYAFHNCSAIDTIRWNVKKDCLFNVGGITNYPEKSLFESSNTNIKKIIIGNEVEVIPQYLCYNMHQIRSINIPSSVTTIGKSAFYGCSGLNAVHISDIAAWCGIDIDDINLEYGSSPLAWAKHLYMNGEEIIDLIIPEGVTLIKNCLFYNAISLATITIPSTVTSIGWNAIRKCTNLSHITCNAQIPPEYGGNNFSYCENLHSIYVPCGTLDAYRTAWSDFSDLIKYKPTSYQLTLGVNNSEAGRIILTQDPTICNNTASIEAIPNESYVFDHWSDDNTENPREVIVDADIELTAYFSPVGGTDIEDAYNDIIPHKVLQDGQIFILRGDKTYTITGAEVK